jgi:hypothetical protein
LDHLKYRHLEHPTIFPRCQPLSRGLATGAWFQFRAIAGGRRRPESPDVRLQQKIMIPMFRPRFRSRDAAFAAATRLTHLVPGHDYEAWQVGATGFSSCVIVMITAISVSNLWGLRTSLAKSIIFKKKHGPRRGSKFFRQTTSRQRENLPPHASPNLTVAIPKNGP